MTEDLFFMDIGYISEIDLISDINLIPKNQFGLSKGCNMDFSKWRPEILHEIE